jgi:hypothetical protein
MIARMKRASAAATDRQSRDAENAVRGCLNGRTDVSGLVTANVLIDPTLLHKPGMVLTLSSIENGGEGRGEEVFFS